MSDYYMLFSQTFYGLLFSCLTITDVTPYEHPNQKHLSQPKTFKQIITVNSSTNAHKKITLARFACLCFRTSGILFDQGWVDQKLVTANPGLKVNRSIHFSSIKMFFIDYVLCSFRFVKLEHERQTI